MASVESRIASRQSQRRIFHDPTAERAINLVSQRKREDIEEPITVRGNPFIRHAQEEPRDQTLKVVVFKDSNASLVSAHILPERDFKTVTSLPPSGETNRTVGDRYLQIGVKEHVVWARPPNPKKERLKDLESQLAELNRQKNAGEISKIEHMEKSAPLKGELKSFRGKKPKELNLLTEE